VSYIYMTGTGAALDLATACEIGQNMRIKSTILDSAVGAV